MSPLVSILIHNYNYGRFLRQCLASVFNQNHSNLEVVFSDNASDDESWRIAEEFADKHPGKMTLIRQKTNRGPEYNSHTVYQMRSGEYFCLLCSDDAMSPDFIERTVEALENNPKANLAMVHRYPMDADGEVSIEPPFYNRSCVIPGRKQAAVYMMSSCAPCISQMMYRSSAVRMNDVGLGGGSLTSRWFGPRILDFNLCLHGDFIYIAAPLILHRIHEDSDSSKMLENMVEPIGQYLLIHQLAETAKAHGCDEVAARLQDAIRKHSYTCVKYALGALIRSDYALAERYLSLANASNMDIVEDGVVIRLWSFLKGEVPIPMEERTSYYCTLSRTESYDPPEGSRPLK